MARERESLPGLSGGEVVLGLGPMELVVIIIVAILILGPQKTVSAARSAGKLIGETKKALGEATEALKVEE